MTKPRTEPPIKDYRIEFGTCKFGEIARRNLLDCLDKNWVSGGPKVAEFEDRWGKLFDYPHNIAVSSGTDAVLNACLALYDLSARRGDEVITPALSFIATSNAVLASGLTPVFADVELESMNLDPSLVEAKITPRTRAIVCVHTMGKPCEMDVLRDIADRHDLLLIEDSAEAHGAKYKDQFIGTIGDMATFSFYVAHLICCGEGGMVSTKHSEIADVLRSTRTHGRKNGDLYFDHERHALNSKMNDLEASLGLEGLEHFWWTFNKRRENLLRLVGECQDLEEFAWFNQESDHEVHCPHAFSILLKEPRFDCKALTRHLEEHGVKTKRNFGSIPTQHKAFAFMGAKSGDYPNAEYIGDNGIHVGCHQYLTDADLDYMIGVIHDYFGKF